MQVTLQSILAAHHRLQGIIRPTPLESATLLPGSSDPVYLKLENLQKTGSFKIRGAVNKIASLTPEEKARGVVTASSGNHAQGVGYGARLYGLSAKVFVPRSTPLTKIAATRQYGVEVVIAGTNYDESEALAQEAATRECRVYIHAYGDPQVIAGQGTVGLEMLLERPDLETIVVPTGGGGLIAGIAVCAKTINPAIRVIGVQSVASPPWYYALRAGKIVEVQYSETLADGLAGGIDGGPFDLIREYVDSVVLVEEAEIAGAMGWMMEKHHQIIEGSGAVGIAALRSGVIPLTRNTGVVVSGGNVDRSVLKKVI